MNLKDLYNKKIKFNPQGDATPSSGRHGVKKDGVTISDGPDKSYQNWPGWMSGDYNFKGNTKASNFNIDGTPEFKPTPK